MTLPAFDRAKAAIRDTFRADSGTLAEVQDDLERLRDDIDMYIEAIKADRTSQGEAP